jgi:transcriptional regulator with XRE-family HTH domain
MQPAFASDLRPQKSRNIVNGSAPEPAATIGEICRTLRQQSGVSLRQMALLTHRDTSTLSRFERGHTNPRDTDALVKAYQNLAPIAQVRPQRSDRPRIWPLAYAVLSMPTLLGLTLAGPARWDSNVARAWLILSLLIITVAVVPTIIRDARAHRHPVAIAARAGYIGALTLIATSGYLNWDHNIHPLVVFQGVIVVTLGMVTIAYDRLERENGPAE